MAVVNGPHPNNVDPDKTATAISTRRDKTFCCQQYGPDSIDFDETLRQAIHYNKGWAEGLDERENKKT